jgi:hypothetical protein
MNRIQLGWTGLAAIGLILFAGTSTTWAQGKKPSDKHDGAVLYNTLRDVINTGAKIFNEHGDHAGCYRLYQGSLISVRPFLAPDMQKSIDDGLATAEKLPTFAERAFELRRVLDDIRVKNRPADLPDVKDGKGAVSGHLTYQGKPVAGGYFVTLVGADSKKFSSAVQKDGSFNFATPIATGEYRVAVEPIPADKTKTVALPTRYASESTSGLSIRVQSGKQVVDLNLVN